MSGFKTRTEMALEYSIHRNTFIEKLKRAGIILPPRDISPNYQQIIYAHFGLPPFLMPQIAASNSTFVQIRTKEIK